MVTVDRVIHKAIKRHAGLSDWDDENIESEVKAIVRAIKRDFTIVRKGRDNGRSIPS